MTLAHVWRTATINEAEKTEFVLVGVPGLEPGTSSLSGKRSNRLSYTPKGSAARNRVPRAPAAPTVATTAILYRIPATTRIDGITGPRPPADQPTM